MTTMFALMADLRAMGETSALLDRAAPAGHAKTVCPRGRNLCRALFRPRRPDQGKFLDRLDVGLGAGCLAAKAAEAGFGEGVAGEGTGKPGQALSRSGSGPVAVQV